MLVIEARLSTLAIEAGQSTSFLAQMPHHIACCHAVLLFLAITIALHSYRQSVAMQPHVNFFIFKVLLLLSIKFTKGGLMNYSLV